jgi:polyisoprenoid-binding protein YceI
MKFVLGAAALLAAASLSPETPIAAPRGEHDWKIDPVHSSVVFRIQHAGASWFYGSFGRIRGTFTLDPKEPAAGTIAVEIEAASVSTHDQKRDDHLRSPDFFDAKQYPKIAFTSTKIAADGDALAVTGELELLGKKRPVTMRVEKTGEGEMQGQKRVGYEATFTIKRSDFGMDYGLAKKALGDEVRITAGIAAVSAGK